MPICLSVSRHIHNGQHQFVLAICSRDSKVILPMSFCVLQKCTNAENEETEAGEILKLDARVDEIAEVS